MSAAPLPAPGAAAISAPAVEMIVCVTNDGTTVSLVDMPVIAWVTDPTGAAPARPIILWPLSPLWAHVVVTPVSSQLWLAAVASDGWRGSFSAFLDRLVATTGLAISGIQLQSGPLVSAFWSWVSDKPF